MLGSVKSIPQLTSGRARISDPYTGRKPRLVTPPGGTRGRNARRFAADGPRVAFVIGHPDGVRCRSGAGPDLRRRACGFTTRHRATPASSQRRRPAPDRACRLARRSGCGDNAPQRPTFGGPDRPATSPRRWALRSPAKRSAITWRCVAVAPRSTGGNRAPRRRRGGAGTELRLCTLVEGGSQHRNAVDQLPLRGGHNTNRTNFWKE